MENNLTKKFNRHIAKILSILDLFQTSQQIKNEVRKELWFLHDDILEKQRELKLGEVKNEEDFNR